jgi:hypothetical protein
MQYFFEHNTRGVFAQGNEYGPDGSDLEELRCYLITNLLWNPYCDFDELMREFTDFYYGAAAPFVREYIETVCSECAAKECHVSCYQRPDAPYLAEDSRDKYDEVLDRAEAAVQEHPLLRLRIQKIRLSTRYARLRRQLAMDHLHDAEALNRFISDCESLGVTFVQEGITKNRMLHALVGEQWRSWKLKGTKEVLS